MRVNCLSYPADSGSFRTTHRNPTCNRRHGTATAQPSAKPPSTYPQIVRLSYVEGDVRISRGKLADKQDAQEAQSTNLHRMGAGRRQSPARIRLQSRHRQGPRRD